MAVVAFALLLFSETPYRWRRLPVGDAFGMAVALPTKGRRSFIANGSGFVVRDLVKVERIPMAAVTGVALGDYAPDTIVAVGKADKEGNIRFSLDGGDSWRPCPTAPLFEGGTIAVSSTGRTWVWSGPNGVKRTDDYGFNWSDCDGLPAGSMIVADRTSSGQFYAVADGKFYVSADGAKVFEQSGSTFPNGDVLWAVVPTPGHVGDNWFLVGANLYHALPGKASQRAPGVTNPTSLSFSLARGISAPGPLRFTLFLAGRVEGRTGLFRSDDDGASWSYVIGGPENIVELAGDPAHVGRLYVVPQTGGVWVGDPG